MAAEERDPANLWDLLSGLETLHRFTALASYSQLLDNELLQSAVERAVTLIGAAAGRVSSSLQRAHPEIRWQYLAELGRKTREQYDEVDYRELWELSCQVGGLIESVRPLVPADPIPPHDESPGSKLVAGGEPMTEENGLPVDINHEGISEFCRRWRVRRLWLFGSVLNEDFRTESDVDVLVEFEEGETPGLGFFTAKQELEALFGRGVDLLTLPSLRNPFVRQEILRTCRLAYAA